jgi:hypothetical protein
MRAPGRTGWTRLEALPAWTCAGVRPARATTTLWRGLGRLDPHVAVFLIRGPLERGLKAAGGGTRYLESRFGGADADRADILLGDVAATAKQRQQPTRIGIVASTDIDAEPDRVFESRARAVGTNRALGGAFEQFLRRGQFGPVRAHQHACNFERVAIGE